MEIEGNNLNTSDASGVSPILQLLHQCDQLVQAFQWLVNSAASMLCPKMLGPTLTVPITNRHYAESINQVEALESAHIQHQNLSKFLSRPSSSGLHSSPQSQTIRDRTLARLAQTGEEALQGIRDCLAKMEQSVDGLSQLLFQTDVYLSQPSTALQFGLNPQQALQHIGSTHGSYQAELLAKRETFADMNTEDITMEEFVKQWKVCGEIQGQQKETMDDLADALGGMDYRVIGATRVNNITVSGPGEMVQGAINLICNSE